MRLLMRRKQYLGGNSDTDSMREYLAVHAPELETLDDWIVRVKARGHAMLEEKQLKFHICVPRRGI